VTLRKKKNDYQVEITFALLLFLSMSLARDHFFFFFKCVWGVSSAAEPPSPPAAADNYKNNNKRKVTKEDVRDVATSRQAEKKNEGGGEKQ
jgi:hypothetical protein